MKVFVSSTSRDLTEHRAAAIRSLRRLGHQVIAMEEFTAAASYPLDRVLELVREADGYVVIVAWRYGFVPDAELAHMLPLHDGDKRKSITEWEFLAAVEARKPILPFILADTAPWPPGNMDGFDPAVPDAQEAASRVRAFRTRLMSSYIVSFFTDAEQLESLVGVAVAAARLSRQVNINRIGPRNPLQGNITTPDSSYTGEMISIIRDNAMERVITIDIATGWWSTRLYLLAFLLSRFTAAQRVLVVEKGSFVGLLPLTPVIRVLGSLHPELVTFEDHARIAAAEPDVTRETDALVLMFEEVFRPPAAALPPPGVPAAVAAPRARPEVEVMFPVTGPNLARWFPDALLASALTLQQVERASPLDLVRIFDYPGDFVPVIESQGPLGATEQQRCHVIDKGALSLQLAKEYVTDLLDESRT